MDQRLHVLGIRHHGPGSAATLLAALDEIAPAVLLVEAPADAEDALLHASAPQMRPPLALLLHDEKEPSRASFFPFATYSPEWQAILFAQRRGLPVRAIDLPARVTFAARVAEDPRLQEADRRADPLDEFAKLAGYSDGEAWWDAVMERTPSAPG